MKLTPSSLNKQARAHPVAPKSAQVQLELKRGKWSKRFLELKDGTLSYSKSEKVWKHSFLFTSLSLSFADNCEEKPLSIHGVCEQGKDSTVLCQLSNFSVFYVDDATAKRLKAPKPFVFALKSRLTRAHFEDVSAYSNFVAVKSIGELESWISSITEAAVRFFLSFPFSVSSGFLAA